MSDQNLTANQVSQYQPLSNPNNSTPEPATAPLNNQAPAQNLPPTAPSHTSPSAKAEPAKTPSFLMYLGLAVVIIIILAGGLLAFWRPSWLNFPALLSSQNNTASSGYNQDDFLNDGSSSGQEQTANQKLLASFSTNISSPDYLPLTTANSGKYQPQRSSYVPYVLDSDNSTLQVFAKASQTVVTIPQGWVGETIPNKKDIFVDPEHSIELTLDFFTSQKEFTTTDDLKGYLTILFDTAPTLGTNTNNNISVEKLDKRQVLVTNLQTSGNSYSVYHLNPDELNKLPETILKFGNNNYTRLQERELLDAILQSQQILGIDPNQPFELSEFSTTHNIQ